MVVTGTTPYKDTKEAYPLDKKTLRRIAFRSFFMRASDNAETGSSVGWTWAITPGLKKIHTDPDDLHTAMGQNLEYNQDAGMFSTFVMGVSLSLEAQKADPAVIRSVRTSLTMGLSSLQKFVIFGCLLPWLFSAVYSSVTGGSYTGVLIFAAVVFVLNIILRFALIGIGYKKGSEFSEKAVRNGDRLKHASVLMGIFTIGAWTVAAGSFFSSLSMTESLSQNVSGSSFTVLYGLIGLGLTVWVHYLLTRKNWSIGKCIVLMLAIGALLAGLSLLGTPITL